VSDLVKALKGGVIFEIAMPFPYETRIIAKHGERQLFVQYNIKELNDFEQLEVAAQAANRLLSEQPDICPEPRRVYTQAESDNQ
jgi:hypothetical protein